MVANATSSRACGVRLRLVTVGTNANGDSIQQSVTPYRVDPQGADGAGAWVSIKQQDYGVVSD